MKNNVICLLPMVYFEVFYLYHVILLLGIYLYNKI